MIGEDFCSYEVAKLLKEKGFPQEYDIYHALVYNEEDYEDECEVQRMVLQTKLIKAGTLSSYPIGVPEPKCYCPTHQMAMKWLREVHGLSVETFSIKGTSNVCPVFWKGNVVKLLTQDRAFSGELVGSYEEAVEEALKYSLTNLI